MFGILLLKLFCGYSATTIGRGDGLGVFLRQQILDVKQGGIPVKMKGIFGCKIGRIFGYAAVEK